MHTPYFDTFCFIKHTALKSEGSRDDGNQIMKEKLIKKYPQGVQRETINSETGKDATRNTAKKCYQENLINLFIVLSIFLPFLLNDGPSPLFAIS